MTDELKKTIRLMRRKKVETDGRGRSVWTAPVEETELELVSTVMLKNMLKTASGDNKKSLDIAAAGKDGVLARNVDNDEFEIIDNDDLQAALADTDDLPADNRTADVTYEPVPSSTQSESDELSLVSTQALRRILGKEEPDGAGDADELAAESGFDPYNNA